MPQGTVTTFDSACGFGYMTPDGGTRPFVDFTATDRHATSVHAIST